METLRNITRPAWQFILKIYWCFHEHASVWHRSTMQRFHNEYPNSHIGRDVFLEDVKLEGGNNIGDECALYGQISIGYGTTLGRRTILHGGAIDIGRYVQIGPSVAIYAINHSYTHMTTYLSQELYKGRLRQHARRGRIILGNDIWIGHGAIILNNVVINDGAVVGAGSIVTQDVPSFAIVAGNPAHILKYRFDPETVELLLSLKWWNFSIEEFEQFETMFHIDYSTEPEKFRESIRFALSALKLKH